MTMKRQAVFKAGLGLVAAGLLIQFIPVSRTNPPVTRDVSAPTVVKAILRGSCYDCHSHETVWPWYSRVAPVSWMIAADVREGREHLNFSTWDTLTPDLQRAMRQLAWKEVRTGAMPPAPYLLLHPDARLDDVRKKELQAWMEKPEG